MTLHVPLPELSIYFSAWISTAIYLISKLYSHQNRTLGADQTKIQKTLPDLVPGWKFISRLQDVSDYEWNTWKYFIATFWSTLIINFIISETIRRTKKSLLTYWYIASGMTSILFLMGIVQFIFISSLPISYMVILFIGANKVAIWTISIAFLSTFSALNYSYFFWDLLEDWTDEQVFLLLLSLPWTELRCISYCIDYVDHKNLNKKQKSPSFVTAAIDMLSYVFYLPIALTGPFILYEDFKKSFLKDSNHLESRLKIFLKDCVIFLTYTLLLNMGLHYIYIQAMQQEVTLISHWPLSALCGGILWIGFEFHIKYVIMYGTSSAFARLDNIDAPPTPRCVFRVHIYSQMWRYFDVGHYKFLVKYIYRPSYELISKHTKIPEPLQKQLTSLLIYTFICLWHGAKKHILMWSALNYIGLTLEKLARLLSKTDYYRHFKTKLLKTEANEVRFIALICTPLLIMSIITNLFLVAENEFTEVFIQNVCNCSLPNALITVFIIYCTCQVSMAVSDIPSRTYYYNSNS